jgi:hypothetical protein
MKELQQMEFCCDRAFKEGLEICQSVHGFLFLLL